MAHLETHKLGSTDELDAFLKGAVTGGLDLRKGVPGLKGLKLVLSAPAAKTITFTGASALTVLSIQETKSQIETQSTTTVKVLFTRDGRLIIVDAALAAAVAITGATSTASEFLGFTKATNVAGKHYNKPGGGTPELVNISPVHDGSIIVVTEE